MASPLGLASSPNNNEFSSNQATQRYDPINRKWVPVNNSNYSQGLFNKGANISYYGTNTNPSSGDNLENDITASNPTPHGGGNNDPSSSDYIYNITTPAILDWSQKQSNAMKLYAHDFAYLRYIGVYPNNRLIICRKFGTGIGNDLSRVTTKPVSTLISWSPPGQDFFKISYGEEWTSAEASFEKILNEIGGELGKDSGKAMIGEKLAGGLGAVPLPGFTEIFQRKVMEKLGLVDKSGADIIPSGTPNLIKEAKRRATVGPDEAGSGLNCSVSIPVKIEYEQKFIGGLDPTKAFYDILGNIAQFGTQDAVFYLNGPSSGTFSNFIKNLKDNPRNALKTLLVGIKDALVDIVKSVTSYISDLAANKDKPTDNSKTSVDSNALLNIINTIIEGIVKKYEIRILGVANALTGAPSGPWHVTLGNPKRPVWSSGDMIVTEVNVTLGETLAFNDLPSRISVDFTLKNARALGLSEIMSRFMQGQGRSYIPSPTSWANVDSPNTYDVDSVSNTQPVQPIGGVTASGAPIGGNSPTTSGSDSTSNNNPNPVSNQSFSAGSGQESSSDKSPDPNVVRYPSTVTTTPTPAPNDVITNPNDNASPGNISPGSPAPGSLTSPPGSKPLSESEIGKSSNGDLVARQNTVADQLATTPETVTDSNGVTTLNIKYLNLKEEQENINYELDDRSDHGTYNPNNPTPAFTPAPTTNTDLSAGGSSVDPNVA